MTQKRVIQIALVILTISTILHLLDYYLKLSLPNAWLVASRWMVWAFVVVFAFKKRSLTTWILVSMIVGVEVGLNFPVFSQNLQVLSKIFLRLIKTIIAPILFATLVVGIAGHSNIRQVGRMGLKSIIYFELVTTMALVIGLVAINLSQAGAGIVLPDG
ncbi:MAG: cation:dicarboxylase symporter family transporter, partial [Cyclobacteriaceae bacterium]|nr:cation:dicarboxylase symporter family transporter [Cyclobacteriaceae bacterium]